jgi:hypothetical protein
MSKSKKSTIDVQGTAITILTQREEPHLPYRYRARQERRTFRRSSAQLAQKP